MTNRVWFITGASRGFGALIAEQALAAGDSVVATARTPETVTQHLGAQPRLLALPLDVTDEAQARAAAQAAIDEFGRIDVLVSNAGFGLLGAVEEASAEQVAHVFNTNVFGLLNVTRAVLPQMRARRTGHVINISSVGGLAGSPGWGIYSATKFAVEGLTEALAAELKPLGIHVTAVEPGYFRTDFLDDRSLAHATAIADYATTAGAMRQHAARVNHAQPGDPAKLAEGIMRLVESPEPPTHLPFGADTLARVEAKRAAMVAEFAQWHDVTISTDHTA